MKRTNTNDTRHLTIGKNIEYYRKQKGMERTQLAEYLTMSVEELTIIETHGTRQSDSTDLLFRVADILGIDVRRLLDTPKR